MNGPELAALAEVARDEWSDPLAAAVVAAEALLELTTSHWIPDGIEAVNSLRSKRRDSAVVLAVTEAALWEDPHRAAAELRLVMGRLADDSWARVIASALAPLDAIHILSIGETTLTVLDALVEDSDRIPAFHAGHPAVARGLGYLDAVVSIAEPHHADAVLLPVVAAHGDRLWTAPDFVRIAAEAPGAVIPVHHPLASMSPLSRRQYRPPPHIIDTRVSRS